MYENSDQPSNNAEGDLDPTEVYEEMEVLEPYVTGELASRFEVARRRIQKALEQLSNTRKIRKKEPERGHPIWIRDAPIHECPECGYTYEVKFLHPILSSVRFCPQCGKQL